MAGVCKLRLMGQSQLTVFFFFFLAVDYGLRMFLHFEDFPGSLVVKTSPSNGVGSIPGQGAK